MIKAVLAVVFSSVTLIALPYIPTCDIIGLVLSEVVIMAKNPLCEVFGFPIINTSEHASNYREYRLCPYNNISANCTKDKAQNPLGVCTIFDGDNVAITCPVRFRQNWI